MTRLSTIEIYKENMKFSAAHFTIFSDTHREHLHGHNYTAHVALTTEIIENGLSFDYRFYKDKLFEHCQLVNHTTILPMESKYMQIEAQGDYLYAYYNGEKIPFLKSDVTLLPICNTSVEELSNWFLQKLIADPAQLEEHNIKNITVKIFSGPGQSGSTYWERT